MPPDDVRRVNGAAQRALKSADLQELGFEITVDLPESFVAWIRVEIAKWSTIARAANVKVQGTP